MKQCCPNCFESEVAKEFILSHGSDSGSCSYCGKPETVLVKPVELRSLFLPLLNIYVSANERIYIDRVYELEDEVPTYSLAELITMNIARVMLGFTKKMGRGKHVQRIHGIGSPIT